MFPKIYCNLPQDGIDIIELYIKIDKSFKNRKLVKLRIML